jgi:type IX secretion system PorP/SprF family membrane protein
MISTVHAQIDPMFFQQTANRVLLNPAAVGKGGDMRAALTARQQWAGFPGASTQAVYASGFIKEIRSGFGLTWINDKFGPQQTNNLKLNYAHFVPFNETAFLALGIGMGVMNNNYDEATLSGREIDDPLLLEEIKRTKTIPDFDFGVEFNTKNLEIGASVTHITYMYTDQNLLRPMRNIYAYTRVKLPINRYWDFIPGITWHNARNLNTCEVNMGFRYNNNICVNMVYRNPVDCGIILGANLFEGLRIAYSYDYGFDNLSNYNNGSHEITVSYTITAITNYIQSRLRFFRWKMF